MAVATLFTEPRSLPELLSLLLAIEPQKETVPVYLNALSMLAITFMTTGQKGPVSLLRERARQLVESLADSEQNAWGWYWFMEAIHSYVICYLPYTLLIFCRKSTQAAHEAGNRHLCSLVMSIYGLALGLLGEKNEALSLCRSSFFIAEQTKDEFVLNNARIYLARQLIDSPSLVDWEEIAQLARLAGLTKNFVMRGKLHLVLSYVAQARGDLANAELQARTACQVHAMCPPFQAESTALWSRLLRQQGKDAEALKACEDTMQQLNALELEPFGLVELYVELVKAREQLGQQDAARQALPILKRRLEDIPASEMRATYLREVPENAQLLELAKKCGLDITELAQTAAANSPMAAAPEQGPMT
jgi:hypothetical protein